jgi:hypothetical protein
MTVPIPTVGFMLDVLIVSRKRRDDLKIRQAVKGIPGVAEIFRLFEWLGFWLIV